MSTADGGEVVSGVMEIYRYCAMVGGLASWTEYVVGVRAWAADRVSIAAKPVLATTRSDCECCSLDKGV